MDRRVLAMRVARPSRLDRLDLGVGMSDADIDTEITDEEQPGAHRQDPSASTQSDAEEGHIGARAYWNNPEVSRKRALDNCASRREAERKASASGTESSNQGERRP